MEPIVAMTGLDTRWQPSRFDALSDPVGIPQRGLFRLPFSRRSFPAASPIGSVAQEVP